MMCIAFRRVMLVFSCVAVYETVSYGQPLQRKELLLFRMAAMNQPMSQCGALFAVEYVVARNIAGFIV